VVIGHKCQGCGLVVSEDSRKKEKVGGKNPASVAGAKCPKCKAKMGKGILMGFPQGPSMS
jgi:predicted Zn-ribbon and HTH transcriptional regulator